MERKIRVFISSPKLAIVRAAFIFLYYRCLP